MSIVWIVQLVGGLLFIAFGVHAAVTIDEP